MPDKKISQLPSAITPLTGNELLPVVQSGVTTKVQVSDIKPVNATETVAGIAEIATQAEVNTGTNDTTIVTPAKLASYISGSMGGGDLQSAYNHSSNGTVITDAIRGAVKIKGGTGTDANNIQEFRNNANELVGSMDGYGKLLAGGGLYSFIIPTNVSSTHTNHWQRICVMDFSIDKVSKHIQLSFIQASVIDYITKHISSILYIIAYRDAAAGAMIQCRIENHGNYKLELADFEILYNNSTHEITIYKRVLWNWTGGSCSIINTRVGDATLRWDGSWVGTSLSGEANDSWLEKSIVESTTGGGSSVNNATETIAGIAEIATQAEVNAGTNDTTIVTPAKLTAYVAANVAGLWDDRGNFNASVNTYPSSGGSGTAGTILKGDVWTVTVAGIFPTGQNVEVGDLVRALVDAPGNTQANWAITQNNIAYGKAAIYNSAGTPTYYSSLQATINAASTGDTVQLFANVTEDIVLKNGVNINGNGFTLTGAATSNIITMSSTVVSTLLNINIINNSTSYHGLYVSNNSSIYLNGVILKSSVASSTSLILVESGCKVEGGKCIDGSVVNYGTLIDCIVNINPTMESLAILSTGTLINCKSWNYGSGGNGIEGGGIMRNCYGYSSIGEGISVAVSGSLYKCIGESENGYGIVCLSNERSSYCIGKSINGTGAQINYALYCYGYTSSSQAGFRTIEAISCTGISDGGTGITVTGKLIDCNVIGYSNALALQSDNIIVKNCTIQTTLNANYAVGINLSNHSGHHIVNNDIKTIHASSYCIYTNVSGTAFIAGNRYDGNNGVHPNITQLETRTADAQGNIFIN